MQRGVDELQLAMPDRELAMAQCNVRGEQRLYRSLPAVADRAWNVAGRCRTLDRQMLKRQPLIAIQDVLSGCE